MREERTNARFERSNLALKTRQERDALKAQMQNVSAHERAVLLPALLDAQYQQEIWSQRQADAKV